MNGARLLPVLLLLLLGLNGCAHLQQDQGGDEGTDQGAPVIESENERAAKVNTELGVGYFRQGRVDIAVDKLKRALSYDDSYAPAHHAYALVLDHLGEEKKAGAQFERAYELKPNDSDLANNYGTFLCGQKRYSKAQKLFHQAYSNPLYQTPEYAYANSGHCYEQQGKLAQARKQFKAAVAKSPNYGPALLGLARTDYHMKQYKAAAKAIDAYEKQNRHTAASLKLAIKIDQANHDGESLANHALILRGRFPDSPEAKWYEDGMK